MSEFVLRILQPTDQRTIRRLVEAYQSDTSRASIKTIDWFTWKFLGSPFGPAVVAYAEAGERIAGVVAFGFYGLTAGSADIKAALSYETIVYPDFRRRGLFTQLLLLGMGECQERGAEVMFNFPNAISLGGFVKQGWIPVDCVRSFVKPVNWRNCIVRFDRSIRTAKFLPDRITQFDGRDYEGFDRCLSEMKSLRSDRFWAPLRTPEYMIWRYRTYPLYRYVVVCCESGWAIVRTGKRGKYLEVQILELFPLATYDAGFLRDLYRRIARQLNPDIISITLSPAHPAFRFLWRLGFFPVPNRVNFTYYPFTDQWRSRPREWVLTATEFHTY